MPPLDLHDRSLHARCDAVGLDIDSTSAINCWTTLELTVHIALDTLATHATLEAADVGPQAGLDHYLGDAPVRIVLPQAELSAQLHSHADSVLTGDLDLIADDVDLLRAAERVRIADVALKGQVTADTHQIAIGLEDVRLDAGCARYPPRRNQR